MRNYLVLSSLHKNTTKRPHVAKLSGGLCWQRLRSCENVSKVFDRLRKTNGFKQHEHVWWWQLFSPVSISNGEKVLEYWLQHVLIRWCWERNPDILLSSRHLLIRKQITSAAHVCLWMTGRLHLGSSGNATGVSRSVHVCVWGCGRRDCIRVCSSRFPKLYNYPSRQSGVCIACT